MSDLEFLLGRSSWHERWGPWQEAGDAGAECAGVGGGDRCHGAEEAPAAGEPSRAGKPLPPRGSAPASPTAAHRAPSPAGESTNPRPSAASQVRVSGRLLCRGRLPRFLPLVQAPAAQSGLLGQRPLPGGDRCVLGWLMLQPAWGAPLRSMQTQVPGTGRWRDGPASHVRLLGAGPGPQCLAVTPATRWPDPDPARRGGARRRKAPRVTPGAAALGGTGRVAGPPPRPARVAPGQPALPSRGWGAGGEGAGWGAGGSEGRPVGPGC